MLSNLKKGLRGQVNSSARGPQIVLKRPVDGSVKGRVSVKTERRFLIAPSLVRLILKERFIVRNVVEGYFAPLPNRTHFVRVEPGGSCNIVLQTFGPDGPVEERTKISPSQAEALLDVCAGQTAYRRTHVRIAPGLDAFLDRFEQPAALDLLAVEFDDPASADEFSPPGWFGPEVTGDAAHKRSAMAVDGVPKTETVEVDNASVIALVDTLERHAQRAHAGLNGENGEARIGAMPIHHAENGRPVIPFVTPARLQPAPGDARIDEVLAGLSEALESTGAVAGENGQDDSPLPDVRHTGTRSRR
jgi:CYTH domain-containing protein